MPHRVPGVRPARGGRAEGGALDGRPATTHYNSDQFRFPLRHPVSPPTVSPAARPRDKVYL